MDDGDLRVLRSQRLAELPPIHPYSAVLKPETEPPFLLSERYTPAYQAPSIEPRTKTNTLPDRGTAPMKPDGAHREDGSNVKCVNVFN